MTKLVKLDLSNNHFKGVLPSSLGKCVNLEVMCLCMNELDTLLPAWFKHLTALTDLNLSNNCVEGK